MSASVLSPLCLFFRFISRTDGLDLVGRDAVELFLSEAATLLHNVQIKQLMQNIYKAEGLARTPVIRHLRHLHDKDLLLDQHLDLPTLDPFAQMMTWKEESWLDIAALLSKVTCWTDAVAAVPSLADSEVVKIIKVPSSLTLPEGDARSALELLIQKLKSPVPKIIEPADSSDENEAPEVVEISPEPMDLGASSGKDVLSALFSFIPPSAGSLNVSGAPPAKRLALSPPEGTAAVAGPSRVSRNSSSLQEQMELGTQLADQLQEQLRAVLDAPDDDDEEDDHVQPVAPRVLQEEVYPQDDDGWAARYQPSRLEALHRFCEDLTVSGVPFGSSKVYETCGNCQKAKEFDLDKDLNSITLPGAKRILDNVRPQLMALHEGCVIPECPPLIYPEASDPDNKYGKVWLIRFWFKWKSAQMNSLAACWNTTRCLPSEENMSLLLKFQKFQSGKMDLPPVNAHPTIVVPTVDLIKSWGIAQVATMTDKVGEKRCRICLQRTSKFVEYSVCEVRI